MEDPRHADIIEIAIQREQEAYDFYMDLREKVEDQSSKDTLQWVAAEEQKHKAFLVKYRDGNLGSKAMRIRDVEYYKIAEYQEEPEIAKDMRREEVFLVASHRELKSYNFYTEMAGLHPDGETKTMLLKIANEEEVDRFRREEHQCSSAFLCLEPRQSGFRQHRSVSRIL